MTSAPNPCNRVDRHARRTLRSEPAPASTRRGCVGPKSTFPSSKPGDSSGLKRPRQPRKLMINLTMRQLRYFEALARHGHFGRAADACAISQPALSMQIRELEDALGTELFDRGARQVRLTHFGEEFATRVREILRAVDELGDLARA
eukprot:gene27528-30448_t